VSALTTRKSPTLPTPLKPHRAPGTFAARQVTLPFCHSINWLIRSWIGHQTCCTTKRVRQKGRGTPHCFKRAAPFGQALTRLSTATQIASKLAQTNPFGFLHKPAGSQRGRKETCHYADLRALTQALNLEVHGARIKFFSKTPRHTEGEEIYSRSGSVSPRGSIPATSIDCFRLTKSRSARITSFWSSASNLATRCQ